MTDTDTIPILILISGVGLVGFMKMASLWGIGHDKEIAEKRCITYGEELNTKFRFDDINGCRLLQEDGIFVNTKFLFN